MISLQNKFTKRKLTIYISIHEYTFQILKQALYNNKDLHEDDLNYMLDQYLSKNYVFNKIYKTSQIKSKMFEYYKEKYVNSFTVEENIKYILNNCWKTWDLYQLS